MKTIKVNNKNIADVIYQEIKKHGDEVDLNHLDTSEVTNMNYTFHNIFFNGNISNWDVSNVTDMNNMFCDNNYFNQDISNWNVSNVTDMSLMFESATNFNQDISKWDVSNVTDMRYMFSHDNYNKYFHEIYFHNTSGKVRDFLDVFKRDYPEYFI